MVEMLCGVLSGGCYGKDIGMTLNPRAFNKATGGDISQCFLVIDPNSAAFGSSSSETSHYAKRAGLLAQQLRSLRPVDAAKPVRVPGDRSSAQAKHRENAGIPLHYSIAKSLAVLSAEYNVPLPFESPVV
jgi:LDH2 family malate/lactate/ureidoglycolate dehydrogenase